MDNGNNHPHCAPSLKWRLALALVTVLLLPPRASLSMWGWGMPDDVPVARLIRNLTGFVEEHPDDPEGWYVLGRVHGLAFVMNSRVVGVWKRRRPKERKLPNVAEDDFQYSAEVWSRKNPDRTLRESEKAEHLQEAVRADLRAIELDPKPAHYHLGLAYVLETGSILAERVDVVPFSTSPAAAPDDATTERIKALIDDLASEKQSKRDDAKAALRRMLPEAATLIHEHRKDDNVHVRDAVRELLAEHWREVAITYYFNAFTRSIEKDLQIEFRPERGLDTLVAYEAGSAFVRLVTARGPRDALEKERLADVEKKIAKFKAKPDSGRVTPIIFSLERPLALHELLAGDLTVPFDLNGDGTVEAWPWVRPDTAFLVWDPSGRGKITSGRQLFGSVTWWMFFRDGYRALDALDDDRNGELAGDELRGLAVWLDRDSDGISDRGEVVPVGKAGIEAISVRALTMVGRSPANPIGLRMCDGRVLPTYDWVTAPALSDGIPAATDRATPIATR